MDDPKDSIRRLTIEWTKAQPAVGRFVRSFVRNQADAEDVLQEVALTLVDRFERYDPTRPFLGWALGVARNVIKAHFRKLGKRPQPPEDEGAIDRVADAFEVIDPAVADLKEALADCLNALPAQNRQLLALHYDEDLKPAAIADHIGKSANHVAVMLHRLRSTLRTCVERKVGGAIPSSLS